MGQVRQDVSRVMEAESSRKLTREEARRAAQLRMVGQRLRYEMKAIRDEVLRLGERRARGESAGS